MFNVEIFWFFSIYCISLFQDVKSKRSTQLVPFSLLDEKNKQSGRDAMRDALGTLLGFGYTVEPLEQEHGGNIILL